MQIPLFLFCALDYGNGGGGAVLAQCSITFITMLTLLYTVGYVENDHVYYMHI